jgi:hypothetical protein
MMKHHHEPDNADRDRDPAAQSDRSESPGSADDVSRGSYYYDDATGYEVYDGDEDEAE